MSKRRRSKKNSNTQPKRPASPGTLPEVVAAPVVEIEEEHVVDTSADLDEAQAALDALTAQLSELEALSQETEAQVATISTDYQRSQLASAGSAAAGTVFRDSRERGPLSGLGDRIAETFESGTGRFLLVGGLGLFAVALMVGLIILGQPGTTPSPAPIPPPRPELPSVAMGKSVDLNGVKVELKTWQVGAFEPTAAALLPGGLVIVDLSLENVSDVDISVHDLLEHTDLIDDQDRALGHLVRAEKKLIDAQSDRAGLVPGESQTLRLVFRPFADSATFRLEIRGETPCRIPLTKLSKRSTSKRVA